MRTSRPDQPFRAVRHQSTSALALDSALEATAADEPYDDGTDHVRFPPLERLPNATKLPSPLPERALTSAKLAALHARLSLPQKLPLQTLARALVDISADENPLFNNVNLAFVGQTITHYHVAEWLMCRYPRLPMTIMYAAMKAYAGDETLHSVARSWGVESAAEPGGEVDSGLLQFSMYKPVSHIGFGYGRKDNSRVEQGRWRRGIANRVLFDDDFGEQIGYDTRKKAQIPTSSQRTFSYGTEETRAAAERAHAAAVRAVVGSVYAHCGREAGKAFIRAHILSRTIDVSTLFEFKSPVVELARLCQREDFEPPVARLLSETGRLSRTPVFVVGIFSGKDKLGEAVAGNLDHARYKAAMNSLKSWYLYSPGENVRVPSEMLVEGSKAWEPTYIDIGEIIHG
ncbi:ribonuclease III domain-containing protein [Lasiosphaeria miniovina]|uniref:Large ribosomal subunit protein mL44 n=1 Tax=Lasiosphaeria miniovina TaxID=1954250 RepID=A0AA40DYH5_9PEZI|nr:ribonuclease III domain-containing protein [Lasiosphaeria miniovina]KAK0718327.1 ribonuclease III domain-containing protein [Lasiosphaeria miniovina]